MEHLLFKAATTATDKGTFTAVISTASVDRDRDIIEPSAVVASLTLWAEKSKLVPLAWNHTDEVVGHIDPSTAEVVDNEVVAKGYVDQSTERGEVTWRLVKSGTLSFSFGFLFDPKTDATALANGRYRVKRLDVFEISVVPVGPANNDTRVLAWKSLEEHDRVVAELQEVKDRLCKAEKALEDLSTKAEEAGKERKARPVDPLRTRALAEALEIQTDGEGTQAVKATDTDLRPEGDPDVLRRNARDLFIDILSGVE